MVLSDNIHARSIASLTHRPVRFQFTSSLAYIIDQLYELRFFSSTLIKNSSIFSSPLIKKLIIFFHSIIFIAFHHIFKKHLIERKTYGVYKKIG